MTFLALASQEFERALYSPRLFEQRRRHGTLQLPDHLDWAVALIRLQSLRGAQEYVGSGFFVLSFVEPGEEEDPVSPFSKMDVVLAGRAFLGCVTLAFPVEKSAIDREVLVARGGSKVRFLLSEGHQVDVGLRRLIMEHPDSGYSAPSKIGQSESSLDLIESIGGVKAKEAAGARVWLAKWVGVDSSPPCDDLAKVSACAYILLEPSKRFFVSVESKGCPRISPE